MSPIIVEDARTPVLGPHPTGTVDGRSADADTIPSAFITQEDHPILQRPFYMVHPCQTGVVMRALMGGLKTSSQGVQDNGHALAVFYLLRWFSAVSQSLGLGMSPRAWHAARESLEMKSNYKV